MNDAPRWISFLPIILVMVLFLCTMLALIAIPVVVAVLVGRKKKDVNKQFAQLASSLGAQMRYSLHKNTFSIQGRHHDVPYELTYCGGGSKKSAYIMVVIPIRPLFTLSLRKEDFDTKLSKQIGMATELEIGVPDFDAEFFIRTNDPTSCRNYLSVPKHRAAIRHIHQSGYTLAFTRKHIALRKGVRGLLFAEQDIVEFVEAKIMGLLNAVVVLVKGL